MKYQDIHIPDRQYWRNRYNRYNSSNSIDNAYIYKAMLAQHINAIIMYLTDLMENPVPPEFKANVIKTSTTPPSDISADAGKNVYFQLIFPASGNV